MPTVSKLLGTIRRRARGGGEPALPGGALLSAAEALPAPAPRTRWRIPSIAWRARSRRVALAILERLPPVAAGLAAAIPVINSTVNAINAGWVPAGDDGIIATRGWDVLTSHAPLVGQYSEAGLVLGRTTYLHSPGPMLYWLIALPARFGSVTSIAFTMGAVNTLAIIGTVVLARRRGGLGLMFATAIAIALMCQSLPTESFHDIWNPAAALFPFLLLIFLCWSIACGDHRLLPFTILVASFVTQTHLTYAAPTAVLFVVAAGGLWLARLERRRRARAEQRHHHHPAEERPRRIWPWALAAVAVAAVCWAAPAADQIEHSPGNLSTIVRTVEHRGTTLGGTVGWNAVVRSVGLGPWWLYVPATEWDRKYDVGAVARTPGGPLASANSRERASAVVILAALVIVALLAAFWLRWDLVAAAVIGLGMSAAIGLQAASNPATPLLAGTLGYTLWWGSELGMWVWLILAWALWLAVSGAARPSLRRLRQRRALPARARVGAAAAASVAVLGATVAVGAAVAATGKPDSHHYEYQPTRQLMDGIDRLVPPGKAILFRFGPLDLGTQPIEPAVRFMLVRHGDRVLARGSLPRLGPYYEPGHTPVQWVVDLRDGTAPLRGYRLAARVQFDAGWGHEVLSAWVRAVPAAPSGRPRSSG